MREPSTYGSAFTWSMSARPSSIAVADAPLDGTFMVFQSPPR